VDTSSESNIFKAFLRKNNYPLTKPRKMILRAFLGSNGHIDIQELYRKVKKEDNLISLSTVYRTMHLLAGGGRQEIPVFHYVPRDDIFRDLQ
jgi:Fe2+ or Zn2+ uptake regulation protein